MGRIFHPLHRITHKIYQIGGNEAARTRGLVRLPRDSTAGGDGSGITRNPDFVLWKFHGGNLVKLFALLGTHKLDFKYPNHHYHHVV